MKASTMKGNMGKAESKMKAACHKPPMMTEKRQDEGM